MIWVERKTGQKKEWDAHAGHPILFSVVHFVGQRKREHPALRVDCFEKADEIGLAAAADHVVDDGGALGVVVAQEFIGDVHAELLEAFAVGSGVGNDEIDLQADYLLLAAVQEPLLKVFEEEEDEEDVIYSCAPEVASTLDGAKLKTLVDRYQIPKELNPRLPKVGEWCCSPSSGLGVYTSYLLAGLRFPLNSFCRDLFQRLGIGPNQLNPDRKSVV